MTNDGPARDYDNRCANCWHDVWQNELVGDCRAFDKDVYHHSTHSCERYERKADAVLVSDSVSDFLETYK